MSGRFSGLVLVGALLLAGCGGDRGGGRAVAPEATANRVPVVAHLLAAQEAREDSPFFFFIPSNTFSDPDGDVLTFAVTTNSGQSLPAWLSYDASTHSLAGTPDWNDAGTLNLQVTATDAARASAATPLQIHITSTSVAPNDIRAITLIVGIWSPLDAHAPQDGQWRSPITGFYSVFPLGPERRDGIAMTAWSYSGFDWEGATQSADTTPVEALLLDQTDDGHLKMATASYVASAKTNGGGSVITTDLNGDQITDVVFLAHNESPFIAKPSTVWLSESPQHFRSVAVDDAVMAHDAQLVPIAGRPAIATMSFSTSPVFTGFPRGLANPHYTWNASGSLAPRELPVPGGGMSITAGDFRGDGTTVVAVGDNSASGYFDPSAPERYLFTIGLFDYADGVLQPPAASLVPYFSARGAYSTHSSLWGRWTTHVPRLWTDDFNQDGRLDLLASASMWPEGLAMLQLFQNQGGGLEFVDKTDQLNPDYDPKGGEVDYSMQRRDLDGSGIRTYFLSNNLDYQGVSITSNPCILINDGTGRLYPVLRDSWRTWDEQVRQLLGKKYGIVFDQPCRFIAYLDGEGRCNFLAYAPCPEAPGSLNGRLAFASITTGLDILKCFKAPVTIRDRNHSTNIRTFGGDDTIYAQDTDPDATLTGGAGTDTVVYSGKHADYDVSKSGSTYTVTRKGASGRRDVLRQMERISFSDETVALP